MQIRKLPHMRKVSECNKFCKSTNLRISRGLGEADSWKKPEAKNLVTLSLLSKTSEHTRMQWCHFTSQNFIKILSIVIIPLKSRVNKFLKINIQEFIFQYRVFTKSIISHSFLNHLHCNNSIYKISTPLLQREGGTLQTDATQLFLFGSIPAKAKKLGLLSIYKSSLGYIYIFKHIWHKPLQETTSSCI